VKNTATVYSSLEMRTMTEINLVENKFEMGELDDAWEHLVRFEEEGKHPDFAFLRARWTARMKDLKGNLMLVRSDLDGAEEIAKASYEAAAKRRYKKYVGKAERLMGRILIERGAYEQAESKLKSAITKLEEVGNPKQLWVTHTVLARLYKNMNRPDFEREQWQAAASIVKSTANGLREAELRELFMNASPVREIMGHAD